MLLLLLPLAWLLVFTLLADLVATPFVPLAPPHGNGRSSARAPNASIITVSFDGKHFLEKLIPSLKKTVAECGGRHEIIIVDNGSSDGTVDWLARVHPDVRCVALPENRFFVRGNMAGVQEASTTSPGVLNSDMQVNETVLLPTCSTASPTPTCSRSRQVFFTDQTRRRGDGQDARALEERRVQPGASGGGYDSERRFTRCSGQATLRRVRSPRSSSRSAASTRSTIRSTWRTPGSRQAMSAACRVLFTPTSFVLHGTAAPAASCSATATSTR
ncbi:MAG: glycosyltransferase [Planctomycetota bacterium]